MSEKEKDSVEEIKDAVQGYVESMESVKLAELPKTEIAAAALILEACIVVAREVRKKAYGEDNISLESAALALFESLTRQTPGTPTPDPSSMRLPPELLGTVGGYFKR